MIAFIQRSISNKLVLVIMATTLIALLVYAGAMLAYDLRSYHNSVVKDVETQANIIAEISIPTLEFDDPVTARDNLVLLRTRSQILGAAIYTTKGNLFASYASPGEAPQWPNQPQFVTRYQVEGDQLVVWQRIVKKGDLLGVVYIQARYEAQKRLINYLIMLGVVLGLSLVLALLIAIWLRGAVTKPIFAITTVARHVMKSRDFSLRANRFTQDEIGVLADAFNDMLGEVERRAKALEQSNQSLEHEMAERHAAEAALRHADQRKDEFLATLAHELRNPLAPLNNGLNILRLAKDKPEIAEQAKVVMERQLSQMVRLVDDLLDVSRINTGKLTINKRQVDIQSVMRNAVENVEAFIQSCGHKLEVEMPPQPIYVNADPLRLAQVFANLLNNAAKYTNSGGRIQFSGRMEQGDLVVRVADTGIGIAPHMLQSIFDMFTQVDQSLERTHAGLGVGLALAKHLVELHGYQITASSQGPGQGSTFTLRITPLAQVQPEQPQIASAPQTSDNIKRILLVDDNVDFVTTMSTLLTSLGHQVRIAHKGTDALEIAKEFKPEIGFLDIGMPGMNGYDLARALLKTPGLENLLLVAITGWGQETDRQRSRHAGFRHHLVKPVDLSVVVSLLESGGPMLNSATQ